jgi:WD40 repeat protein
VYIYNPYGQEEGAIKWSLQGHVALQDAQDSSKTLSWGNDDELLVGSSSLTLFATHSTPELIWTKKLANPVKFADFSHDAAMIASVGTYDCLVKIWHRLSFGSVDQRFDYAYLPHPTTITGLHWRRPRQHEQTLDNVLYTICADNKVRIWVPSEPYALQIMHLWGEIDLSESIQPRNILPPGQLKKRYAFIIDSRDLISATERAVSQASDNEKEHHAIEHLITIANRNPEVCVVLDDRGNMSAWGLENIGCKTRKPTDIFNVAHVDGMKFHFARNPTGEADNIQFLNFCNTGDGPGFTILAHHFDGRLEWLESGIDVLFDPSPQTERLQRKAVWTGHSGPIRKVNRTAAGRALVSRTTEDETIIWTQRASESDVTLHRHSTIDSKEHIRRTALLQEGDFAVFLHHDSISLWDCRHPVAHEAARCKYEVQGKPLCLLVLPETKVDTRLVHIATVTSDMKGIAWEIRLPPTWKEVQQRQFSLTLSPMQRRPSKLSVNGDAAVSMDELCTFELGNGEDLAYVLPVDPAGSSSVISGFFDTFARDVAISFTKSGEVTSWTAIVNTTTRDLEWLPTSRIDTGMENISLASGTSIRKAALVDADRTRLTIWNTRGAQLEYEEKFENNGFVQDLDWSSTPDNQSILAVGFPHKVVIYSQLRYDYLDAGPSWAPIREFRTRDVTPHPIGDSVWLSNGHLVIGAGNQLFVQDENIEVSDSLLPDLRLISRQKATVDIFTLVTRLNGTLPVFHPQFLTQCMLAGKVMLVQKILVNLYKKLKWWVEGDELDSFLGQTIDEFSNSEEASRQTTS